MKIKLLAEFWAKIRKISQNTLGSDKSPPERGLKGLKVLVSPLDWGLGHGTRMIPLIHGFLGQGARVWLAADGAVASLLSAEFPQLPLLALDGYKVRYPRQGRFFIPAMLSQLPRLVNAISSEKVWLDDMQPKYCWDLIVSDNRYGLYHADTRNVLVTHQLYPKSGNVLLPAAILRRMHERLMRPFHEIWIPDAAGPENLSGDLSHPPANGMTCHYIGPLSRMHPVVGDPPSGLVTGQYLLALVSGPEPQRSILEEKVLASAEDFQKPVVLVRGLPGSREIPPGKQRVTVINHADPSTLASLIVHAGWVVCRSGYSTLMDLVRLRKKALLVPTPGQTEQEYLADYLQGKNFFPAMPQASFTLEAALDRLQTHGDRLPVMDFEAHETFLTTRFMQTGNHSQPFHESVT